LLNLCDVPKEEPSAEWDILCEASSEIESGARFLSAFQGVRLSREGIERKADIEIP
jgi:hypothetical protein